MSVWMVVAIGLTKNVMEFLTVKMGPMKPVVSKESANKK